MRCVVFAYDFPHWKSWMGIQELALCRFSDLLVLAAPRVSLASPPGPVTRTRELPSGHPYDTCRVLGIQYVTVPHAGGECEQMLARYRPDVGIVLGARILPRGTLQAANCEIINIHPGVLPENRGLDNVPWAVEEGWPQGVTAHVITPSRIDAGPLLGMHIIRQLQEDESLVEVSNRLDWLQLGLLFTVAHSVVMANRVPSCDELTRRGPYHSYFTGSEAHLAERFAGYRERYPAIVEKWEAGRADLIRDLGLRFEWAENMDAAIRSVTLDSPAS